MKFELFALSEAVIGEGPFWSESEHVLYWVDPLNRRFFRQKYNSAQADFETFELGIGSISAFAATTRDTLLLFADGCRIWEWQHGSKPHLYAELNAGQKTKFNDITTGPNGECYCTVLPVNYQANPNGIGELWQLLPGGEWRSVEPFIRGIPNGMGFAPDCKTFYYTASSEGIIYAYDYDMKTTMLSNRRTFASIGGDGLAVDSDGGVWSAVWGGRIVRFLPDGTVDRDIPIGNRLSSLCFGGDELEDIFITTVNYPYDRRNFLENNAGALIVCRNSGYRGMRRFRAK